MNLIVDAEAERVAESFSRRKNIDIQLYLEKNKPIKAVLYVDERKEFIEGELLQEAIKQPLTLQELEDNFSKSELFKVNLTVNAFDKIFITKKLLNEFRRKVFERAFNAICLPYRKKITVKELPKVLVPQPFTDFEVVEDLSKVFSAKNVIYSPAEYSVDDAQAFVDKCVEQGRVGYLDTPNFALKKDVRLIKEIAAKTGVKIVANNYYALTLSPFAVVGGGLHVFNGYSAAAHGKPFIVAEDCALADKNDYAFMTLRHCPMKANLNASCDKCPYTDGYYYVMESGKKLKLKRKKLNSCTFYLTN